MKAEGYLQIVPLYIGGNPDKAITGVRIERLTKTNPRSPEPGALLVRVAIDVDPEVFAVPTLAMSVDAEPSEVAAAVVPVVPSIGDDDTEGEQ